MDLPWKKPHLRSLLAELIKYLVREPWRDFGSPNVTWQPHVEPPCERNHLRQSCNLYVAFGLECDVAVQQPRELLRKFPVYMASMNVHCSSILPQTCNIPKDGFLAMCLTHAFGQRRSLHWHGKSQVFCLRRTCLKSQGRRNASGVAICFLAGVGRRLANVDILYELYSKWWLCG